MLALLQQLIPPLLAGLSLSLLLEQALHPKPQAIWKRPVSALGLQLGIWLLIFTLLLLLVQRPWFAGFILLAFQGLLLLVNQAKYDSLREPFIFQDFEYFTDAIKHPRLYLPFFGIARSIAATLGFVGALAIGLILENPLTASLSLATCLTSWLVLLTVSILLVKQALKACPIITYNPAEDLERLGQCAFFAAYGWAEIKEKPNFGGGTLSDVLAGKTAPRLEDGKLPHIVVVQS